MSMSWLIQPSTASWLHRLGDISLEVIGASHMLVLVVMTSMADTYSMPI